MAFAKEVFAGRKKLLRNEEVRRITWPNWAEVSVKALYDEFSARADTGIYFPSQIAEGRQLDKEYFFNVLNSVCPAESEQILAHASR